MPSGKDKKNLVEQILPKAGENYEGFLNKGIPQNPSAIADNLGGIAAGENIKGGSPQFKAAQDYQAGKLATDVNRSFSGMSRFGSGAHAGVLADSIGNFRNQGTANEIARQQGSQLQAAGALSGEQQGNQQTALNVTAGAPGFLAGDPRGGNQLGGAAGGALSGAVAGAKFGHPLIGATLGGLGGWLGGY